MAALSTYPFFEGAPYVHPTKKLGFEAELITSKPMGATGIEPMTSTVSR